MSNLLIPRPSIQVLERVEHLNRSQWCDGVFEGALMGRFDDGTTGGLFEEEVLGRCTASFEGYLSWKSAVEVVRKNQPRQKTAAVETIEREFSRRLGEAVRLYTAVGSAMDFFHGVDGFFIFRGEIVTVDLTCNPHKDCGKADLILTPADMSNILAVVVRVANEFATKLKRAG